MQLLFTAPINRPLGEAAITGIKVQQILMDLDVGTITVVCAPIEDGIAPRSKSVVLTLTPTQITNFTSAIKSAVATALNVTLQ